MYRTTLTPHHTSGLRGRFALIAICGFVLLSAGFAFATALLPSRPAPGARAALEPDVIEAEYALRETLDERLYGHLRDLSALRR